MRTGISPYFVRESFAHFGARRGRAWPGIPRSADYTVFGIPRRQSRLKLGDLRQVVAHADVGCLSGEVSSGNCGKGAVSAAVSEYLGEQVGHVSDPSSLSNWGIAGVRPPSMP